MASLPGTPNPLRLRFWKPALPIFAAVLLAGITIIAPALSAPNLVAQKVDVLVVDNDADNVADPGDSLRYIIVVTNTGSLDAGSVILGDTIDANTTLAAGSLRTTPIARHDSYASTGNVGISVPPGSGLLANDNDPDGTGGVSIVSIQACADPTAPFDCSSVNGGNFSVAGDGSFTYNPPPGFEGTDQFGYTVQDSNGNQDPALVFIVVSEVIWFVDNSAGAQGDGRLNSPFNSLDGAGGYNATAADDPGDTIFIYTGSGPYGGGITLQNGQVLVGQGANQSIETISGVSLPAFSNSLPATSGGKPTIENSGGDGITLAANNLVRGLNVGDTGGTGVIDGGSSAGVLTISEASITGTGGGIELVNGGNLSVTLDSLTASSSMDEGIHLVNVDGSFSLPAGSIDTSGVPAVVIDGDPSLALSVSLDSVSANGGTIGIWLQDTSGSFTVTGSGGACSPSSPTCTGGHIQNMSGADGAVAGNGIYLSNATNVSLSFMHLNDFENHAIAGSNVISVALETSYVHGVNGTSAADDEGSLRFTNLLGAASINDSHIEGGLQDNLRVVNNTGTLDRLTVSGTTIGPNSATAGNDGILVEAIDAAALNVTITNSTFTSARGDLLQLNANNTASMNWVVTGNAFSNNHPNIVPGGGGVTLSGDGAGSAVNVTYDVDNNSFRDALGIALNVFKGSGAGTFEGRITNNTIGVSGVALSGSAQASGIQVTGNGNGTHTTRIENNTIVQYSDNGIYIRARDGSGLLNATVLDNTVSQPGGSATNGLQLEIGAISTDTNFACADIQNNSLVGSSPGGVQDFQLVQSFLTTINLPGYIGVNDDNTAVASFIQSQNAGPPSGSASNDVAIGGGGFIGGGTCPQPIVAIQSNQVVQKPQGSEAAPRAATLVASLVSLTDLVDQIRAPSLPDGLKNKAAALLDDLSTTWRVTPAYASGETVSVSLGDLNPGQQVAITFDVTVDATIPANATQVCNQGLVTSNNSANIITDDPQVGGGTDPTCTAVPQADLSIGKSDSADPVNAGAGFSYTVNVVNSGPSAAQDVVVTDTLSAGVTYVSDDCGAGPPAGQVLTWNIGTLANGGSAVCNINVTAPGSAGTITNNSSASTSTPAQNSAVRKEPTATRPVSNSLTGAPVTSVATVRTSSMKR